MTIVAMDPTFDSEHGVLFGLQSKREVDDPVPAIATTEFRTVIEVRTDHSGVDFAGEHVHGPRGDRFIYLVWGQPDRTVPFVMFARAKIKLGNAPRDLLDQCVEERRRLVAEFHATDARGRPASGTIKPPAIHWRMH